MSDPKRWTDSGSEVDSVLQSVVRYARNIQPSSAQVSTLLERLNAVPTELAPLPRRALPWKAVAAGVVVATGAAASYGVYVLAPPPRSIVTTERPQPSRAPEARPRPELPPKALEVEHPHSPERSVVPVPASRSRPVSPPSAARTVQPRAPELESSADPEGVSLLQAARLEVASAPTKTLSLTEQHAAEFPKSALREEREALRIQALFRLQRNEEAERELARFEAAYPSSPYRRQLRNERPILSPAAE